MRRMISLVPWPSAVASTIFARQMCLAMLLRSAMIASSRVRFAGHAVVILSHAWPHLGHFSQTGLNEEAERLSLKEQLR